MLVCVPEVVDEEALVVEDILIDLVVVAHEMKEGDELPPKFYCLKFIDSYAVID